MQNQMRIIDHTGDTKKIWDSESDVEVEDAERTFKDLKKKGYVAYKVGKKGAKGELMDKFDPEAGQMIMAPPVRGG